MENGYLVQWTERQRLEFHPENAGTEYEVLLGLLGRELTRGLDGPRFSSETIGEAQRTSSSLPGGRSTSTPTPAADLSHFFTETGHLVSADFLSYWQEHGGVRIFGYPISNSYRTATCRSSGSSVHAWSYTPRTRPQRGSCSGFWPTKA